MIKMDNTEYTYISQIKNIEQDTITVDNNRQFTVDTDNLQVGDVIDFNLDGNEITDIEKTKPDIARQYMNESGKQLFSNNELEALANDPELLKAASQLLMENDMKNVDDQTINSLAEVATNAIPNELRAEYEAKVSELVEQFPDIKVEDNKISMLDKSMGVEVDVCHDVSINRMNEILHDTDSMNYHEVREQHNINAGYDEEPEFDMSNARESAKSHHEEEKNKDIER